MSAQLPGGLRLVGGGGVADFAWVTGLPVVIGVTADLAAASDLSRFEDSESVRVALPYRLPRATALISTAARVKVVFAATSMTNVPLLCTVAHSPLVRTVTVASGIAAPTVTAGDTSRM
jgi:hypothetical protein